MKQHAKRKSGLGSGATGLSGLSASVVGKKEGEGPLGKKFDVVEQDAMFGAPNWEQAESAMQKQAADLHLRSGYSQKRCPLPVCGDPLSS